VRALIIVSTTASRSLRARRVQTRRLGTGRMAVPPSGAVSMEGGHQLLNGGDGQDGRLGTRLGGEVGAVDRDVAELAGEDLDLAVADVAGQAGESRELQRPAEEGVGGVGNGDLALAFLRDQGGIT
jgi:hypothetical protein